jgi:galactokinase
LDYVRAVVNVLNDIGFKVPGMELEINTTIPVGTGLSSSAALCISAAYAISEALELGIDTLMSAAEIAYTAERKRLGINCGQMDPYASAQGGLCYIDYSTEPPEKLGG